MRILGVLGFVLAAACAWTEVPAPSQFDLHSWDTRNGLPEETIYSVVQTPDRYLWLANANGLVRYDGNSFETFQPRHDLGGAVRQEISRMGAGPDSTVWVYSASLGLVRFVDGRFRRAPAYPTPCNVKQIQEDGDATLIVCAERVLRIAGEHVEQLYTPSFGPENRVQSATRDEGGRLWLGFFDGGVQQLDLDRKQQARFTPREGLPPGPVNYILSAGVNRVWVAMENGLALIDGGHIKVSTIRDGLPANHIRRLAIGRDGTLWVGTVDGVALLRNGRFELVSSLPGGNVETIVEDREENIWVTFSQMNLYRLHKPKFLNWGPPEGLLSERPLAVLHNGNSVWISQEGGFWRLKGGKISAVPVGKKQIHYLENDSFGQIWALSDDKAYIVDPDKQELLEVPITGETGRLFTISPDHAGRMWAVGRRGVYLGEHGRLRLLPIRNLPALHGRSTIRESRDGRIWLSVERTGLFELGDGQALPVKLGDDTELNRIHTFYIDAANDFWFGLDGGGLVRWRNGKVSRYGHQIGRPHNFIYHFGQDTEGYFWLGVRAGLLRIRTAELNDFLDGKTATEPTANQYDIADGLRSFNFGGAMRTVASLQSASVLWFPNLLGLIRIDSRDVAGNRVVPPVHMLEVSADDRALPLGNTVSIPAGSEILGFKFSAPTLVGRNRMQIRYRLEPFDQSWHTIGFRSVSYTRVPPGTYTFSVSASNNDGVWNDHPTSIRIVVQPRFYQTWWFRLLTGVFAALGVAGLYYWRTSILRQEKAKLESCVAQRTGELSESIRAAERAGQAKSDFLATMSHEIRTPMHGVLGILELLSETGLNPQQSDYLNIARTSSTSLLCLLNDILDLSKMDAGRMDLNTAPFSLRQTVEEVTRLLQAQANLQRIDLSLHCAPGIPQFFEGDEMRIRQIVFNLAGNAVKFTPEGHVTIQISGHERTADVWALCIAIRDTGIGIPTDRIPELFQNFVQVNSAANRRFTGSGLDWRSASGWPT